MSNDNLSYRIFPLGDLAITIEFGTTINNSVNDTVLALFNQLTQSPFGGIIEIVPAYSTLTIYYDTGLIKRNFPDEVSAFEYVKKLLIERLHLPVQSVETVEREIKIPVCYDKEFALDIETLSRAKNISVEEIVSIHSSKKYKVYMLGFLPGFAYMAEVNEKISISRKAQPVQIAAGSVGIAGVQTGIYPFSSPGGWHIIGRTPLKLFNSGREQPVLLRAGDIVQFYPIGKEDFFQQENALLF